MRQKHDLNRPLAWGRGADKLLPQLYPHIPGVISPNLKREVAAWIAGAFPEHTRQIVGEELLTDTLELMETMAPQGYVFYENSHGWGFWPTTPKARFYTDEFEDLPPSTLWAAVAASLVVMLLVGLPVYYAAKTLLEWAAQ